MKYLMPLLSLDLKNDDLNNALAAIIDSLSVDDLELNICININLAIFFENDNAENKILRRIRDFNLLKKSKIKIVPSMLNNSKLEAMSLLGMEDELKSTKLAIHSLSNSYEFIDGSFVMPFYFDYKRHEVEKLVLKYFHNVFSNVCYKGERPYLILKRKHDLEFYSYFPFFSESRQNEKLIAKSIARSKNFEKNFCFLHYAVKNEFSISEFKLFLKVLNNLKDFAGIQSKFDFYNHKSNHKQVFRRDLLNSIINPDFKFSPKEYESLLLSYKDEKNKKFLYSSYFLPNKKKKTSDKNSNEHNNLYYFNTSGFTELSEKNTTLYFKDASLNQIHYKEKKIFKNIEILSSIHYKSEKSKRIYLPNLSIAMDNNSSRELKVSYSFLEDDKIKKAGYLSVTYMFIHDFSYPIIHLNIKYPRFKDDVKIKEFSPFSFRLIFSKLKDKHVEVLNKYPDLSSGILRYTSNFSTKFFKSKQYKDLFLGEAWILKSNEGNLCLSMIKKGSYLFPMLVQLGRERNTRYASFSLLKKFEDVCDKDFANLIEDDMSFVIYPEHTNFLSIPMIQEKIYEKIESER